MIENHVRLRRAQGFVTNIGGLVTVAITIPANITGLALIQCRMIAGIAHLRGYDLDDPRVRNAILTCMLGEDVVTRMVKKRQLPGTADGHRHGAGARPRPRHVISAQVAAELISKVAGKRLATTFGRRIPIVGGFVGMGADAYVTWRVGRYADRELLPRARR